MIKKPRFLITGIWIAGLIAFACGLIPAQAHSLPVQYNKLNLEGYFSQKWWQWLDSNPQAAISAGNNAGFDCAAGQSGVLWYLPAVLPDRISKPTDDLKITLDCNLPAGKVLFFPVMASICSADLQDDPTYAELRDCAVEKAKLAVSFEAELDGAPVQSLSPSSASRQALSPLFYTDLPAGHSVIAREATVQASVSDGWWILLPNLPIGRHIIHVRAEGFLEPGQTTSSYIFDVTYRLSLTAGMGKR